MPDFESWRWLARDYADQTTAHTFVRLADLEVVRDAFHMSGGTVKGLTRPQARHRIASVSGPEFNAPPFQVRLCPLGEWTLVIEEDQILDLVHGMHGQPFPAVPPGTPVLHVTCTITTGVVVSYRSGVPGQPVSFFGAVTMPGSGYLRAVADRVGFDRNTQDWDGELAKLLAAVADDLAIPIVRSDTLEGPLPTVWTDG